MKRLKYLVCISVCLAFMISSQAGADDKPKIGDHSDGSMSVPVHIVNLYDEQGNKIALEDETVLPFSNVQTCGECHSVDKVATGWHFNAIDKDVDPGRPGQAWIYTDPATGTQIPLSYRNWPGAYSPDDLGITAWQFAKRFARQSPGPFFEDLEAEIDFDARWMVSGELEINCLACHDAEHAHDQSQYSASIAKENFHWAPAATTAFASVTGSAKDMSESYDYLAPTPPNDAKLLPPGITYDENRFDATGKIFLDITRDVPNERCYFCHSNSDLREDGSEKWMSDQDVHIAAGLNCVDCHRHGLDHNITRGYKGEKKVSDNPMSAVSSCKGCHLPKKTASVPVSGRFAAPEPKHAGIPLVHFKELSCTACHSGPWPEKDALMTKTARAHALGTHSRIKTDEMLPHIQTPVFKRLNGKITPHKTVYPAFWGSMQGDAVVPLNPEEVKKTIGSVLAKSKAEVVGNWPLFTDEQVVTSLKMLSSKVPAESTAVYVAAGKLHQLGEKDALVSTEHAAAEPYGWPIAHDVRPAAQSLGVKGCKDCHTTEAPFVFGNIKVDSPLASQQDLTVSMVDFQEKNPLYMRLFAMSFVFRPMLKIVSLLCVAAIGCVVLLYVLRAFGFITEKVSDDE